MKKLLLILGLLLLPTLLYAATAVPWNTSNVSNGYISPTAVNGTAQGVLVSASSTIGNGTQARGLTISGGATTTLNAYFTSNVSIGTQSTSDANGTNALTVQGADASDIMRFTNGTLNMVIYMQNGLQSGIQIGSVSNSDFGFFTDNGNAQINFDTNRGTAIGTYANNNTFGVPPANGLAVSGSTGIGTTTPYAKLSVQANNGETNRTLFAIGSSTQSATTTLFSVSNTGNIFTALGNCNATTQGLQTVSGIIGCATLSGFASSTLLGDINTFGGNDTFSNPIIGSITGNAGTVTNGVYTNTFNGLFDNRLSASSSISGITTLPNLLLPYGQLTGVPAFDTFAYPFGAGANNATTSPIMLLASTTIGNGTITGGLTVSGNATTTGNLFVGSGNPSTLTIGTLGSNINYNGDLNALSVASFRLSSANGAAIFMQNSNNSNGKMQIGGSLETAGSLYFNSSNNLGIGTSSPFARLSIEVNPFDPVKNLNLFAFASTTQSATSTLFMLKNTGQLSASSSPPVLSSCGTGPVIDGTDNGGFIIIGSTATGCTATFANAWPKRPECTVVDTSESLVNAYSYTVNATGFVFTETSSGGTELDYHCGIGL